MTTVNVEYGDQIVAINVGENTQVAVDAADTATTQADRASLQAFLGNQPFADETELEAYTNALLEVGDSTITRDGGVYVLTDLDPLTWVREDDSDGKKAENAVINVQLSADRAPADWTTARDDMLSLAPSGVASEGLPNGAMTGGQYYDWAKNPQNGTDPGMYGVTPPLGWNAMTPWLQVYYEADAASPATNTRFECRNLSLWVRTKAGVWNQICFEQQPQGGNFLEDFGSNTNITNAYPRREMSGGMSGLMEVGRAYHAYGRDRVAVDYSDITAIYSSFEVRLTLDDPNGVDDRDDAHYVASGGADWWKSKTASAISVLANNGPAMMGRFRRVTNDWKMISSCTLPYSQITAAGSVPPGLIGDERYAQYAAQANTEKASAPETGASEDFADSRSTLNLLGKSTGRSAFDTVRNQPLWAAGSQPNSSWVNSAGAVVETPINLYRGYNFAMDFRAGTYRVWDSVSSVLADMPGYSFSRTGFKFERSEGGVFLPFAAASPGIVDNIGYYSRAAAQNRLQNSVLEGGSGSGSGTAPTNWGVFGGTSGGLSRTLSYGAVSVDGATANYVDVRLFGTNSSGAQHFFALYGQASGATVGETWQASVMAGIVAGSATAGFVAGNGGPSLTLGEISAGNASLGATFISVIPSDGNVSRRTGTRTLASASVATVRFNLRMVVAVGGTVDVTVRMFLPQIGVGSRAGPYILTAPNTTASAGSDNLSVTPAAPGSEDWMLLARATHENAASARETLIRFGNSADTDGIELRRASDGKVGATITVGGTATERNGNVVMADALSTTTIGLRRKSGELSVFAPYSDGFVNKSNSLSLDATSVNRLDVGHSSGNSILNGALVSTAFFRGTWSDTQASDMVRNLASRW